MGFRELKDLLEHEDTSENGKHYIFHVLPFILGGVAGVINHFFAPSFESWPDFITDFIMFLLFGWTFAAILFGIPGIFCVFLGLLTYKDYQIYYIMIILWLISTIIVSFWKGQDFLHIDYAIPAWIVSFIFILVVSIMNRFNNMSKKIDEIHKKLQ